MLVDIVGRDSLHLQKLLDEPQSTFCLNTSSQLQIAWVLICWNLLCQKLQMFLMVKKNSRQLQIAWEDKVWEKKGSGSGEKDYKQIQSKKNCKQTGRSPRDTSTRFLTNHIE